VSSGFWLLGGEPVLIGGGQLGVVEDTAFEAGEAHGGGAEVMGCGGEGDPGRDALLAEVGGLGNLGGVGQQVVHLAGDLAL
jgi:hypothetical protein